MGQTERDRIAELEARVAKLEGDGGAATYEPSAEEQRHAAASAEQERFAQEAGTPYVA